MALLVFEDIHAGYGNKEVLGGLSFVIEAGQIVALLGGNGAGKSTALKVAAGLLRPWSGSVRLNGEDVTGMLPHEVKHRGLSYLPQGGRVFKRLTVAENLALAAAGGRKKDGDLIFPQLRALWPRRAGHLSGGERQMLAIQMALCMDATAVLMDEPTAALVGNLATEVLDGIGVHARSKGIGVLLVEQNVEEARRVADGEINLAGGTGSVALAARRFRGITNEGGQA